ncbi:hypothetical protein BBO_03502 [Beauveria brongniartii RCEF 3172]|uniref:Uncharacterized protein n=1 Tax=Beauveria brongniartii RCEF 3172 TaxID=1081107 RepID=A0A167FX33_9HYPO|nr:hypothetical protein BBO_03502 [Beauveria brongniartii RCEF 3172]
MPAKLVKVRRGLGSGKSSLKSTAKASTESLHVENASPSKEPSSSQQQQQKNAANLTSDQARAMVLDAFRSASSRLHVQNGKGILGSIAPPHNETVTKGAASGPQSPELVDITTRPGDTREKAARRQVHVAEAQKATQGLYLYLPGLGFKYQDDDNELGQ